MLPSAITPLNVRGRTFFIKRDDLIDPFLSGNKYRKLHTLLQSDSHTCSRVISYGGNQSNAMLSIAALCHRKGWQFDYLTPHVPLHVKQQAHGNLYEALKLGMQMHEFETGDFEPAVQRLFLDINPHECIIPQGGADPLARNGVALLAREIEAWQKENAITELSVVTPSGTGTTAYYLAQTLSCDVITTPLVGSESYLRSEMAALGAYPQNLHIIETRKRFHFGKPYREYIALHRELEVAGVTFDLLYAPKMWIALLEQVPEGKTILYVHSGGVAGNATMMARYARKGWV